ncbi:uncharacterized protein LOC126855994 [Cataglyphis hispanica]|uniref:uncharacterized protein LOC126855994 n=1 Tax=Cataglyphis hispanica TaxID=1086592 RepID=UPI00218046B9|nr:uncharacterized protein LOC126855994 [Cataglyphis hispanica]
MIRLETQFFNLNKILLLTIGLWPYRQSYFTRLQFIFLSTILTTSLIFQCTPLISQKCTPNFVAKVLSSASFFALFVIKYNMFCINIETMKDLLEQLQHIYNKLKDKNEFAIIDEYRSSVKRCTTVLTLYGICSICALILCSCLLLSEFWSKILDVILPINVSPSRSLPITMEYFVDQETYFYWILLHINVSYCIGATAMVGIGTTLIAYLQYTCGMFKISSYRIKRAVNINTLKNTKLKNGVSTLQEIISAIDIHRQAIRLSKLLVSKIEKMLFCLIIVGVVCLSLNLFQIASYEDNIKEILFPFIFVTICITYMFVANYVAQDITDHNSDFFAAVYDVKWYEAPLHIQKLILFLLQKGAKDFTVGVGGLFVGSLECFATLVKASVSYFTVIYSTQ